MGQDRQLWVDFGCELGCGFFPRNTFIPDGVAVEEISGFMKCDQIFLFGVYGPSFRWVSVTLFWSILPQKADFDCYL